MKKQLIFLSVAAMFTLSACGNEANQKKDETRSVKEGCTETKQTCGADQIENEVKDVKQLVHGYSNDTMKAKRASITSTELVVTHEDDSQTTHALPKDEFFVSIAPYTEKTHPCKIHNLIGCQGEKKNEEFDVKIEDAEGKVIIDKKMKSNPHGFVDIWLPREQKYKVTISQNGKAAKSELSTFENDNTCITTMQLK